MNTETGKKRLNFGFIGLGIALVGLLIVGIVFLISRLKERKLNQQVETDNEPTTEKPRTNQKSIDEQKEIFAHIYEQAREFGFGEQAAKAIAGQSAHETGRWSSPLANNYFNIFGMKAGGAGQGIESGTINGFNRYKSADDSISDLFAWMAAKGYPMNDELTIEQHVQWLKSKKYYEDSFANYKRSVLSLANELSEV